jgi:hypothetical protein
VHLKRLAKQMASSFLWPGLALLMFFLTLELLRRRAVREKYAAIWIIFSSIILVLSIFPEILETISKMLGIRVPSNLLFFLGIVFLAFVVMQLSLEVGKLEGESQELALEVAILRNELDKVKNKLN